MKRLAELCTPRLCVVALSALVLLGCAKKPRAPYPSRTDDPTVRGSAGSLTFEAGRMLIGAPVVHTFSFTNDTPLPLALRSDSDIHQNCGCSSIVVEKRQLEPGEKTSITVTIQTSGLRGQFAKGGDVVWTSESGEARPIRLTLRGEAVSPLTAVPEVLTFEPGEVAAGLAKEIRITANVPIDWRTLRLSATDPNFQIELPQRDESSARCLVRCTVPEGRENVSTSIEIAAWAPDPAAPDNSSWAKTIVPAIARQIVELSISPRTASLAFPKGSEAAKIRFLLAGRSLEGVTSPIARASCPGYQVSWTVSRTGSKSSAVVEFTLAPTTSPRQAAKLLTLELQPKKIVEIPLIDASFHGAT